MTKTSSYEAAQRAYDNMSPSEGPGQCSDCEGHKQVLCQACKGEYEDCDKCEDGMVKCSTCGGSGMIDPDGNPFWPLEDDGDRGD